MKDAADDEIHSANLPEKWGNIGLSGRITLIINGWKCLHPMKPVHVSLNWTVIDWHPDDTWKKVTLPCLIEAGVSLNLIDRSVYVIRLNGDYAVAYPGDESPAVYIGEGNFGSRINSHR